MTTRGICNTVIISCSKLFSQTCIVSLLVYLESTQDQNSTKMWQSAEKLIEPHERTPSQVLIELSKTGFCLQVQQLKVHKFSMSQ